MNREANTQLLLTTSKFIKERKFWLSKLSGELPELKSGLSARYGNSTHERLSLEMDIPGELSMLLVKMGKGSDLSIYIFLLTVLDILIYRHTGDEDIMVVSPLFKEHITGETLNDRLWIRDRINGETTFREMLMKTRQSVLEAYENQDYPVDELIKDLVEPGADVEKDPVWLPRVKCGLTDIHRFEEMDPGDESLIFSFHREPEPVILKGKILYDPGKYDKEDIRRLSTHFIEILSFSLKNVDAKVSSIPFLSEEEKKQLVDTFNNTAIDYPKEKRIHELFEDQVEKNPDRMAIVGLDHGSRWSDAGREIHLAYRVLNAISNRLAHYLLSKGVEPDMVVAITGDRSVGMVIGILGILKAGGGYLPIDPDYPQDRKVYMLKNSDAKLLLSELKTMDSEMEWEGEIISMPALELEKESVRAGLKDSNPCIDANSANTSYVLFTSGSTGRPKGAEIEHYSLVNRLLWQQNHYPLTTHDVLLLKADFAFDVSVMEIFWTLITGAKLTLLQAGGLKELPVLLNAIEKYSVGYIHLIPSMLERVLDYLEEHNAGKRVRSLRWITVGGEPLRWSTVQKFKRVLYNKVGVTLHHMYGLTEATIDVTNFDCPMDDDRTEWGKAPIGKPVDNIRLYILDKDMNLQPVGAPGQLCIAGDGIARGYLNNPELTAKKIIDNPLKNGEKLFLTGDRARWLPDGNIEFLGRQDHQIKIRGYRIELGEIENHLLAHEGVKEVVVVHRQRKNHKENETNDGDSYLCAYFVGTDSKIDGREDIKPEVFKDYLSKLLPAYMIPSYFVEMDKIPLTPNGKINRAALPEPVIDRSQDYIAPQDAVERKLAEIWSEILGIDENIIGVESNFFALGGHSLKAIALMSKIQSNFEVLVPFVEFFKTPIIRKLAKIIKESSKRRLFDIEPVEKKKYYLLSSAQKRLYIMQKMEPGSIRYNMPKVVEMEGNVDRDKLENIFRHLIQRHEGFRTSFLMIDGEPFQQILENVKFEIESHYLNENGGFDPADSNDANHTLHGIIDRFIRPFDLSDAPLLRVGLIHENQKGPGDRDILLVDMHHIISDGTSLEILIREFFALNKSEELPALSIQYKDFAEWQRSESSRQMLMKQEKYWLNRYEGDIPRLNIPTDFPKKGIMGSEGNRLGFTIETEQSGFLKEFSQDREVTIYMMLLAIYNVFLREISGCDDIIVGTAVNGRMHPALDPLIGMFVNMLALRNRLEIQQTFKEFLQQVKENTLAAFENQDYPFDDLVEKIGVAREVDLSSNPLIEAVFAFNTTDTKTGNEKEKREITGPKQGLKTKSDVSQRYTSKFDLVLFAVDQGKNIQFFFEYNVNLFKKETIQRYSRYYTEIISHLTGNPDVHVQDIDILTPEMKKQLLDDFNDTKADYPRDKSLNEIFESRVEQFPDRIALIFNHEHITYRQLDERAGRLAQVLREKGVTSDSIAAVLIEPSIAMPEAIMGILKAGGAYLPIDVNTPGLRVKTLLEDSQAAVILLKTNRLEHVMFSDLMDVHHFQEKPVVTATRPQITDLDSLPLPNRSLVDYAKYSRCIGISMVKNNITMQTTRGCPYNCAYCHKIWPKRHISRSAEHIFQEVKLYYDMGYRNFTFVDDIFNLDIENSRRFFNLIINNNLDVHFHFPAGVRGDILTKDYIDLMVKAGTTSIALALETASPRLQRLIGKNLNIERFRENTRYFIEMYPHVILELFTIHGFPTETQEEALLTLDFIKSLKWVHFPYFHILKIFPNTDMEQLALKNGIKKEAIHNSENLAYHELPETLPFEKSFSIKCQAEFFNEYFLSKERLLNVLPIQMKALTEEELVQKYDSYLPVRIKTFDDLLEFTGIEREQFQGAKFLEKDAKEPYLQVWDKMRQCHPVHKPAKTALRILLLDLSQLFSTESEMLYDVVEAPLGLMNVMTYLYRELGDRVDGRIAKSRIDFDNYLQLKSLLEEFQPDIIGIRALTFYKEMFHRTTTMISNWGFDAPVIAGGPYATSDYERILKDPYVDLVVMGEGEVTFCELVSRILENNKKIPNDEILKEIKGIAFVPGKTGKKTERGREIVIMDAIDFSSNSTPHTGKIEKTNNPSSLAYIIFTSGSTGKPKGVMIEHRNVVRLMMNDRNLFDFNENDTWTLFHSYSFDFSVWEIFGALLFGGKLVIIPWLTARDPGYFLKTLEKEKVTVLNQTPSAFYNLVDAEERDPVKRLPLRYVIFGGEALSPIKLKPWWGKYPSLRFINMYGITETTVHVTFREITLPDVEQNISNVGKPIPTLTTYLMDNHLKLTPIGAAGELFVGGDGVARGYMNRPELTLERFPKNPYKKEEILYRSGDRMRFMSDGELVYCGRVDHQVKIRGFRVEPGEIENVLLKHPDVKEAVVLTVERERDINTDRKNNEIEKEIENRFLCAYVVPSKEKNSDWEIDISSLRRYLSAKLPAYMVPSYIIPLKKIPLTVNGKVDRKALPDPESSFTVDTNTFAAPRTDLERKMVELWSEILGIEPGKIGIDANFFELGGHSLKAITLETSINKIFETKIPMAEIFKNPTVKELSSYVEKASKHKYISIKPAPGMDYYPLSSAQKRLFFLHHFQPENESYNVPFLLILEGEVDKKRLEETFKKLMARHESLRTSFHLIETGPVQKIHHPGNLEFEIEYYETPNPDEIIGCFFRCFDLSKAPLLRVGLVNLLPQRPGEPGSDSLEHSHLLLVDMHHIITDAFSMSVFIKDFLQLYENQELPPNPLQYKDYAVWENSEEQKLSLKIQENYWLKLFMGKDIPALMLPCDYDRPLHQSSEGDEVGFIIGNEETKTLKAIALEENVTLYMLLLSLITILLSKLSGQDSIIVGTAIAGRRHDDLKSILGYFLNTLPLWNCPRGEQTFLSFLNEVKETVLNAFENQDYPLDDLVEKVVVNRVGNRMPLFDVTFGLEHPEKPSEWSHTLKLKPYTHFERKVSTYDMMIVATEHNDKLTFRIKFKTTLFKKETIQRFISYFHRIIEIVIENPLIQLKTVEIATDDEKARLNTLIEKDESEIMIDFNL